MKPLIVVATKAELAPLFQYFKLEENNFIETKDFDLLITGVGMVATAFALGKYLNNAKHNLVLNVGIAGCFDRSIALGSLLNITEDIFAELGADNENDFLSIKELGFGENNFQSKSNIKINLPVAKGITVNCVSGNEKSINKLIKRLNPTTESMEGAAVFYACKIENINCLQIRSVSNYIETRNRENWKISLAIKNLNDWTIPFIALSNPRNKIGKGSPQK